MTEGRTAEASEKMRPGATTHTARLKDVALRAGVNTTTASKVLNGTRSGTRVSEETERRIRAVAAELCYHPNAVGRSLSRRRSQLIGFYGGSHYLYANNTFLAEMIGGLQYGCDRHEMNLLLYGAFLEKSEDVIFGELTNGTIAGLILRRAPSEELLRRLLTSPLPVVAVAEAIARLPSVVADDRTGGRMQARHLAEKGHRHVVYMAWHEPIPSATRRLQGFQEEADATGMRVITFYTTIPGGVFALEPEARRLLFEMTGSDRPTAVACWVDNVAEGLLRECRAAGVRVPEDLAVIGFNGNFRGSNGGVSLTTIEAPWFSVADRAVGVLMENIAGGRRSAEEITLPVSLLPGDTT